MPLKSANRSGCQLACFVLRAPCVCAQQIVDQHLGLHLFLDVERRRVDDQVAPVLLVLAAPDELRVEVAVAALVGDADRVLLLLLHDGLIFRRGNVLPLVASSCLSVSTVLVVRLVFLAMISFLAAAG